MRKRVTIWNNLDRLNHAMEDRDRKLSRGKTFFDYLPLRSCKTFRSFSEKQGGNALNPSTSIPKISYIRHGKSYTRSCQSISSWFFHISKNCEFSLNSRLAFAEDLRDYGWSFIVDIVVDICFLLDILIKLFLVAYEPRPGVFLTKKIDNMKFYIR